ncbi:MAG: DUF6498-containing protein [Patescibacteria group bacterium]
MNTKNISGIVLLISNIVFIALAIYQHVPLFAVIAGYIWQSVFIIFFSILRLHRNYTLPDSILHPKSLPVVFSNQEAAILFKKVVIFCTACFGALTTTGILFYYHFSTLVFSYIFDAQQSTTTDNLLPEIWRIISPFTIGVLLLFASHTYSFAVNRDPRSNTMSGILGNTLRVMLIAITSHAIAVHVINSALASLPESTYTGNDALTQASSTDTLPYAMALIAIKIIIDLVGHYFHHHITDITQYYKNKRTRTPEILLKKST